MTEFRRAVRYSQRDVARGERVPDRHPSNSAGRATAIDRQPSRTRLRPRDRGHLPDDQGPRRCPGPHVVCRAAPDFDHQGFWADLLSSEALAVNLFGDFAADPDRADRALQTWWPGTPGRVPRCASRTPRAASIRATPTARRYFDAVFELELPDGSSGALAIDVKYREVMQRTRRETDAHGPLHRDPRPLGRLRAWRGRRARSGRRWRSRGSSTPAAFDVAAREWPVDVGPVRRDPPGRQHRRRAVNDEYRKLLVDNATFTSTTIEDVLAAKVLAPRPPPALRRRYLP